MMYLIIIAAVITVLGLWIMSSYNSLVHSKALVEEAWSGIDVQLKRRYDLIPNLVSVVQGYSVHEKNIIDSIIQARVASMGATQIDQKEKAELSLQHSLKSLFALAEQYPNLKANENFLALQKDLGVIEDELQLARRYYNGTVRHYMMKIMQFPSSLIAHLFNFQTISYFEIAQEQERQNPSIKF
ncbi:MAG: LemA family protein [Candidatus Chromulinivorax sp.]